jgi:hypothetical protein
VGWDIVGKVRDRRAKANGLKGNILSLFLLRGHLLEDSTQRQARTKWVLQG